MASNHSHVERFKVSHARLLLALWLVHLILSCQVADDVAGTTLARQQRTIALSMQLDAARDIREQLKQCYRTHGMNHQEKCKVRGVNFISHSSNPLMESQIFPPMHASHTRVTHLPGPRARVSESKQRVRAPAPFYCPLHPSYSSPQFCNHSCHLCTLVLCLSMQRDCSAQVQQGSAQHRLFLNKSCRVWPLHSNTH